MHKVFVTGTPGHTGAAIVNRGSGGAWIFPNVGYFFLALFVGALFAAPVSQAAMSRALSLSPACGLKKAATPMMSAVSG